MEKTVAILSRQLYRIPGGYFLVQLLRHLFPLKDSSVNTHRTFSFRGINMKVDISKSMGAAIYWRGAHDWAPIFILEKMVYEGGTFIDIGANQGEYSLWAARKVGKTGKVIAFEPMDQLFDSLTENINLNPSLSHIFIPLKKGLSDSPGKLQLFGKPGDNEGVNTMFPTAAHSLLIQEIDLGTLDQELEKMSINKVDFIKLDVEGAELQVLKGSKETIQRYKPKWMIEINEEACIAGGYKPEDILNFLRPFGYEFYKIGLRGSLIKIQTVTDSFVNILAVTT
ncbi:MAG: FkbM family methyltransferase [Mongoliibacter sp.]|uniref:FkbM family methyltransferase n=1 Tax=Mongoliibacter sp. TaxID=2022438 RepID=UPI0012F007AD|nr:FkbM family methyltransferase [Mongoliibacter sp.]TVP51678.1 MAG: FkbM family methyltransferase [Mongoliibacter sp.]